MQLPAFIENRAGTDFLYLPGSKRTEDLTHLLRHKKIGELLTETGLETSCLSGFVEQIVSKKAVDKNLVTEGSEAMKEELEIFYAAMPKKIDSWGSDVTLDFAWGDDGKHRYVPVMYRAYWFTKLAFEWGRTLSYEGYNIAAPTGLLTIQKPARVSGKLGIPSIYIDWRMAGPKNVMSFLKLTTNNPELTNFVDQYAVTYGKNGEPVSVSDDLHWSIGTWDANNGYDPHITVLRSAIIASIDARYADRNLA